MRKTKTAAVFGCALAASLVLQVPVFADEAEVPAAAGTQGTVTASVLNVRASASLDAEILGTLQKGQAAELEDYEDGWYRISFQGADAYVSADWIEAQTDENNVSDADLKLLAAIIHCEAGGEIREGKVAVGAVVLNRVKSAQFPDTISEVVYQSGQFTPAMTGWLDQVLASGVDNDCYEAAKAALAGEDPTGGRLYFHAGGGNGLTIGNQTFY